MPATAPQPPPAKLDPRSELVALLAEQQRRKWANDPVLWAKERLGFSLWWGQRDILNSVRDYRRTVVQSANGIGKTWTAALVCCWWLDTHPPGTASVVTSAATFEQVRTRLWREIHRVHRAGKLVGRLNQTEWVMPMAGGGEETVAIGVKPADNDPDALKGFRGIYTMVIFDEAQAMDKGLWGAALTLITSSESRFLAIGNPDNQLTQFAEMCKPGSGWNHLKFSAYQTPNFYTSFHPGTFKGETVPDSAHGALVSPISVEGIIQTWGITHPFYISQVEGEFPELTEDTLIPMQWIRRAQQATHLFPGGPIELGVDVGAGVNKSVGILRQGPVATIEFNRQTPDTSVILDELRRLNRIYMIHTMKVDAIGIGNTICSVAKSGMLRDGANEPVVLPVEPINVGGTARDKDNFGNLRAEGYWHLRELFRTNQIRIPAGTPESELLTGELVDLHFRTVAGRLYIESKDEIKRRRGGQSPDLADALMLAFMPTETKKVWRATWGRRTAGLEKDRVNQPRTPIRTRR